MAIVRVKSEVAGKVWKVVTRPGQAVAEEDTILIVESMKMEISVATPVNGMLKELLVAEFEVVSEGQDIAIIET